MTMLRFGFAFLAVVVPAQGAGLNPVRKVVTLLQKMQTKVQEEGAREADLYEKFQCYCKTGGGDLSGSIGAANQKITAVSSNLEQSQAKLASAKSDLEQAQADRSDAKTAVSEATALRGKEANTYAQFKADSNDNIAALAKAIDVISKGAVGAFLQTSTAQVIRRVLSKVALEDSDQEAMTAFLSQSSGYVPQSGQIVGILKTMHDEMSAGLADGTATEQDSISSYNGLMAAKKKEIGALTVTIESRMQQIGDLDVSIATMQNDLEDTQAALAADQKFLAELEKSCSTKAAEWEERSKTRAAELVALADTIKVLNDDDALELFKKTLPSASASLLQVEQGISARRSKALAVLRSATQSAAGGAKPNLELVMLSLNNQGVSFDKVIKMIDDMVALLGKEQSDDDSKKDYCANQFDASDDKKKQLEHAVADEEAAMAAASEAITTLSQEIGALESGIRALDKSVAEATAQRKDENAEFEALIASNSAAKEVLGWAKNRLNKFYNPNLYKAPPKVELSRGDRVYKNMGGEVTTPPPGGIAGTGITVLAQVSMHSGRRDAPAPPPDTWGAYASKSGESNGVIAMIDLLVKDLDKEMTEAKTDEANAQSEYEALMADSAAKRTADSQSLDDKNTAKAETNAALVAHTGARDENAHDLMGTNKYISALHGECDWLMKYFDARKQARADEVDSLGRAKAVLSGSDYALLQSARSHSSLRGA